MSENPPQNTSGVLQTAASWILLVILIGYAGFIHQGIGPNRPSGNWYNPTGFLRQWQLAAPFIQSGVSATLAFCLPALLLALAICTTGRSAVVQTIAISCVISVALFTYYGVEASFVWTFFHWRTSAVLALMSLAFGLALAAPILARSWLRLAWPIRIATYLPFAFATLAFIRNATGTNEQLPYAISPWPAVPVFGIELSGLFVLMVLTGAAIGLRGIVLSKTRMGRTAAAFSLTLGLLTPVALLFLGSALEMFLFKASPGLAAVISIATGFTIAVAATLRVRGRTEVVNKRARWVSVGATLLALPLLSGQAMARYDYYVTREHYALEISDALATFLEREDFYPDSLDVLVAAGDLEFIPKPQIGFDFLNEETFRYQNFGTGFILEFSAPRWVQCAYTPPYIYEDDEEIEEEDKYEPEEAWSCPSAPPELW